MKGMTAYQWRVLKRAIRERFDGPEHLQSLSAGRNAIQDVVEEAMRKPSRGRRARVARYLQPAPSTLTSAVESADLASVAPSPAAADDSREGPVSRAPLMVDWDELDSQRQTSQVASHYSTRLNKGCRSHLPWVPRPRAGVTGSRITQPQAEWTGSFV